MLCLKEGHDHQWKHTLPLFDLKAYARSSRWFIALVMFNGKLTSTLVLDISHKTTLLFPQHEELPIVLLTTEKDLNHSFMTCSKTTTARIGHIAWCGSPFLSHFYFNLLKQECKIINCVNHAGGIIKQMKHGGRGHMGGSTTEGPWGWSGSCTATWSLSSESTCIYFQIFFHSTFFCHWMSSVWWLA